MFMLLNISRISTAQNDSVLFTNHIFNESVKTVRFFKEGWELTYPVINLNSDEKLELQFDLIGRNSDSYYYTIVHCSKDWERSDIIPSVYLEGFPENPVVDYVSSFNTTVNYIHYSLTIPNDMISFRISGNYILMIYPEGEPEKPVLTRRFMVSEDTAPVGMEAHRARLYGDMNTDQQVDMNVNISGLNISDPYKDVFAFILQNGRWNNAKKNLKPDIFGSTELKFGSLSGRNIFRGGNEYRYFDIKTIKTQTEYVRKIDFLVSNYSVYLRPSETREFKPYFYWKDFNGNYYVAIQEKKNPRIEADYVYVYFTLQSKYPAEEGKIYVSGALADWSFGPGNLMNYNPDSQSYECVMLLKQGWYNYEYFFRKDGDNTGNVSKFEGNHYETENDYTALIYYRNPRERYDRLIGTRTINTLNNLTF